MQADKCLHESRAGTGHSQTTRLTGDHGNERDPYGSEKPYVGV